MQVLINGLISGLSIALLALAFQLVYLPTKVFHIGMGAIYAAAPFFAWACVQAGAPLWLGLIVGVVGAMMLSVSAELINHGPIERRLGSFTAHFIASLGFYIIVVQALALIWGNEPKLLRAGTDQVFFLGDVVVTETQLWKAGCSLLILTVFFLWLRFTKIGLQLRGLADNPGELALRGYNIRRLRLLSFGLSGAIVAAVALLEARDSGFWTHVGLQVLLLAIVAAIIGGRGTLIGPAIGGLLLGVMRHEIEWQVSARWVEVATFLVLAAFLLLRPNGIIVRKARLEAEG